MTELQLSLVLLGLAGFLLGASGEVSAQPSRLMRLVAAALGVVVVILAMVD